MGLTPILRVWDLRYLHATVQLDFRTEADVPRRYLRSVPLALQDQRGPCCAYKAAQEESNGAAWPASLLSPPRATHEAD